MSTDGASSSGSDGASSTGGEPEHPRVTAQLGMRVARGLGAPSLAAMGLSALGSSMLFILGVVSKHALGMTPVVFLIAAFFFLLTAMSYVEGNSVHPEQGGASTLARYAFDEFWSFVAGWAIILDYLIVMAIAVLAVPHYLSVFWGDAAHWPWEFVIAAAALAFVCWANVRGVSARRMRRLLRLGLAFFAFCTILVVLGLVLEFHPARVVDSIHFGSTPQWDDLLFAAVLAGVAATGIEAASGLAPEIRVRSGGLRRLVATTALGATVMLVGVSAISAMADPLLSGGHSALAGKYIAAPLLGTASMFDHGWLHDALRYLVGVLGAAVLVAAVNGTMLGVSRLTYSLATNRQVPSLLGRLHARRGTPYVAVVLASLIALGLAASSDTEFLAGIVAFGVTLVFLIAHVAVIALRFREPAAERGFRIPLSVRVGRGSVPLPAVLGALMAGAGWLSVLILHAGARYVGGAWMLGGLLLYVVYRRGQDKSLTERFTIPAAALQEGPEAEYGSILVPVFGGPLDDDIVGTAGRLAAEEGEEGEGGAVIEALYVVEVPMSLPLDARIPEEQIEKAKAAVRRAKEVGEEYEGVVVATAMVRARSTGAAIVSEAKRRGVEAIVLAAEPPTRIRGGALLGGRSGPRDRSVGEITRYVIEKAPTRVILTAAPASEPEPEREGQAEQPAEGVTP